MKASTWKQAVVRLSAAAVVIAAIALAGWRLGWFDYSRAAALARDLRSLHDPVLAALIFVGIWAAAGTVGFPALPLMIAGGVLFGAWIGTGLNLAGTVAAATGGYWLARAVARGALRRWLEKHVPVDEMSRGRGIVAIARFRLLPVIPLALGNFAAGLAEVDVAPYLLGTVLGQLPSTVIYTAFADALVRAAATGAHSLALRDTALASGAMIVLSLIPRVLRAIAGRK